MLSRSLLCAALVLAGCSESDAPAAGPAGGKGPPPALVELGTVSAEGVTDGWVFLGQVRPALSAEIAAAAAGHVLEVTARAGDAVRKGQRLVRLDATEVSARLSAAKARLRGLETELAMADKQLARIAKLDYPTVSAPEKERYELAADTLSAQVATQKAEVRRAQVEWGRHVVVAPFAGTVRARHVDPGAWVNVGQPLLEVVSTERLEIHVDVSAELGGRLKVGETATLVGRDRTPAIIAGVVPALDPATGTMRIRLEKAPDQPRPPWLIAGMPIDVEFAVTFDGEGVTVHPDALVRGPVGTRVIKYADGKGVPVTVQVLAQAEGKALVRGEGLAAGDQIVVRGNERLRPGQPLMVKPAAAGPPAPGAKGH